MSGGATPRSVISSWDRAPLRRISRPLPTSTWPSRPPVVARVVRSPWRSAAASSPRSLAPSTGPGAPSAPTVPTVSSDQDPSSSLVLDPVALLLQRRVPLGHSSPAVGTDRVSERSRFRERFPEGERVGVGECPRRGQITPFVQLARRTTPNGCLTLTRFLGAQ